MNAKQAAPLAVTFAPLIAAAPPLLFFGGLVALGIWLLSDDRNKPETASASAPAAPERPGIPLHSTGITVPPRTASGTSAVAAPVPAVIAPAAPKNPLPPLPVIPAAKIQPEIPLPAQKKFIAREDMAKIFNGGRGLTRKSAVSALKALGFGKSAAYEALAISGRFAPWLEFAPDGIIIWKMDVK